MKIHILGIGGTFMAGVALLAKAAGYVVSGSDQKLYPPMSQQLIEAGLTVYEGYDPAHIDKDCDFIVIGNVMRRGYPIIEFILENNLPYLSGPEWLARFILRDRWVLAVAGTHGKTTTSSLLTWIMEYAGQSPSFLIGGVPQNFGVSARLTDSPYFVIEADEYDSAFFDKRSKFLHYRPKTLIINNIEFDHADIFPNIEAIQQQFHYLIRTVPPQGAVMINQEDSNTQIVLEKGLWAKQTTFNGLTADWRAELMKSDGSEFKLFQAGECMGEGRWNLVGQHNIANALAAIAAANQVGISAKDALQALSSFQNVKRRLEVKGMKRNITLYDDFAHHPTAIATTLSGLRARIGSARLIALLELGSYTMRTGVHQDKLQAALSLADRVYCKKPVEASWNVQAVFSAFSQPASVFDNVEGLMQQLKTELQPGDHIVVMSNSGFDDIHTKIMAAIESM